MAKDLSVKIENIHLGLERIRILMDYLGNPQEKLSFVHVAGTNGKGSVSAFIASILACAQEKVGRYISPSVFCKEEFIQWQDMRGVHHIDTELLTQLEDQVENAVKKMIENGQEEPSVFEKETAMAFLAFQQWKCTIVVLEAGLGGATDATNVISHAVANVITPIALDHCHFLGDTLKQIAKAKAGIIKKGAIVFSGIQQKEVSDILENAAREQDCDYYELAADEILIQREEMTGSVFQFQEEEYEISMIGQYQIANACLAACVCETAFGVGKEKIRLGLSKAVWPGRMQLIHQKPYVILDGAHNPAGAVALRDSLLQIKGKAAIYGVTGIFCDKEYEEVAQIMAPCLEAAYCIELSGGRGLDKMVWKQCLEKNGCREVSICSDVNQAIAKAVCRAEEKDIVVVFGSLSFLAKIQSGVLEDE